MYVYMDIDCLDTANNIVFSTFVVFQNRSVMAEGRDDSSSSCHLTPLEEQYIREAEEEEAGMEAQIQREKDMASQKLWYAFQDSATAVAHLFRGIYMLCVLYIPVVL